VLLLEPGHRSDRAGLWIPCICSDLDHGSHHLILYCS
jgi:hypothetical protein